VADLGKSKDDFARHPPGNNIADLIEADMLAFRDFSGGVTE
jgi:hypothetical protein